MRALTQGNAQCLRTNKAKQYVETSRPPQGQQCNMHLPAMLLLPKPDLVLPFIDVNNAVAHDSSTDLQLGQLFVTDLFSRGCRREKPSAAGYSCALVAGPKSMFRDCPSEVFPQGGGGRGVA